MREKELRLALVCFGGISLVVYMHGISKEILKLVRASAKLHRITDRAKRARGSFFDDADPANPEYDTEAVYYDLLREIGRKLELRVVVDIIAGASAGGINGTMLARALAHDLPIGKLRDLWLDQADVTELLASEARAKAWSKFILKPFLWGFAAFGLGAAAKDLEVRQKLSLFLRSRWFKPPLDGMRMSSFIYDAISSMGEARRPEASLLPAGQQLDLFVTVTDFYGHRQIIQIHDPALIGEVEHRHVLHFSCMHWSDGAVDTDFDLAHIPALVFAARATSSFPGAFPPARIAEIDRLVAINKIEWPARESFLADSFKTYLQAGQDPMDASFIDGSVLINKPFREAIQAIRGRPAHREVDRRIVYIDPDPVQPGVPSPQRAPGFFAALRGALSDIPRNEPIADELSWVAGFNERVRRRKAIIDAARPQIADLVTGMADIPLDRAISAAEVKGWREGVNAHFVVDAGFAFEGYVRLKLASVRAFVSHILALICEAPERSAQARAITEIVDAWAESRGIAQDRGDSHALRRESAGEAGLPRWVRFLLAFDLDYRIRRLHFLVLGQNRLYQMLDQPGWSTLDPESVNALKREFYRCLAGLRHREKSGFVGKDTRTLARELFSEPPSAEEAKRMPQFAREFAERNAERIDALIRGLAADMDLDATTDEVDAVIAAMDPKDWMPAARREVLVNYLGFPFWDLLTFSVTSWRDAGEFDEILIDRISPEDARSLRAGRKNGGLKGVDFGHFGAFFSRAYRENDYLLGRLHGIDRLIDLICDCADVDPASDGIDLVGMKRRAFQIVLDAEAPHLPNSAALIAELRAEIEALGR